MSRQVKPNDKALRDKKVRLISDDNEQLGIFSMREALDKAAEVGLDLVAVAENGDPVVCRFMDYGKFRYEEKRKKKEQKKKQSVQKNKEIKFHVNIDTHDFQLKIKHILEFLGKGYKVRVSLFFRGREMAHRERGFELMKEVIAAVGDAANVDSPAKMSGRMVNAQLSPTKSKAKKKTSSEADSTTGSDIDSTPDSDTESDV